MARLIAVHRVSRESTTALPVKAIEPAIRFYLSVLGFSLLLLLLPPDAEWGGVTHRFVVWWRARSACFILATTGKHRRGVAA